MDRHQSHEQHEQNGHATVPDAGEHTAANDVDEAFRAVLEGLRTTLPGVQVLFAFLLTLPLQGAFSDLSAVESGAFYIAFFGSAIASILLIAPSAHQRIRAPLTGVERESPSHLLFTVKMTIVGTAVFAVSLGAAVYLVSAIVLQSTAAAACTAAVALLIAWSWFWVPLVRFRSDDRPTAGV